MFYCYILFSMTGAPGSPTLHPPCEGPHPTRRAWQMWTWSSRAFLIADVQAGTLGPSGPSASTRRTRCREGTVCPNMQAVICIHTKHTYIHICTDWVVLRTKFSNISRLLLLEQVLFSRLQCGFRLNDLSSLSPCSCTWACILMSIS